MPQALADRTLLAEFPQISKRYLLRHCAQGARLFDAYFADIPREASRRRVFYPEDTCHKGRVGRSVPPPCSECALVTQGAETRLMRTPFGRRK